MARCFTVLRLIAKSSEDHYEFRLNNYETNEQRVIHLGGTAERHKDIQEWNAYVEAETKAAEAEGCNAKSESAQMSKPASVLLPTERRGTPAACSRERSGSLNRLPSRPSPSKPLPRRENAPKHTSEAVTDGRRGSLKTANHLVSTSKRHSDDRAKTISRGEAVRHENARDPSRSEGVSKVARTSTSSGRHDLPSLQPPGSSRSAKTDRLPSSNKGSPNSTASERYVARPTGKSSSGGHDATASPSQGTTDHNTLPANKPAHDTHKRLEKTQTSVDNVSGAAKNKVSPSIATDSRGRPLPDAVGKSPANILYKKSGSTSKGAGAVQSSGTGKRDATAMVTDVVVSKEPTNQPQRRSSVDTNKGKSDKNMPAQGRIEQKPKEKSTYQAAASVAAVSDSSAPLGGTRSASVSIRGVLQQSRDISTVGEKERPHAVAAAALPPSPSLAVERHGSAALPPSAQEPSQQSASGYFDEEDGESEVEEGFVGGTECEQCDDGGDVVLCDGPCRRCFHWPLEEDDDVDEDSCNVLGLDREIATELAKKAFKCPNCTFERHKCFICKKIGLYSKGRPSAVEKSDTVVYRCAVQNCSRFYHARCIGEENRQLFICPLHRCVQCGKRDGEQGTDGKSLGPLYGCRRCPHASYHKSCIPTKYWKLQKRETRIWEKNDIVAGGLDPGVKEGDPKEGSFIYCFRHPLGSNGQAIRSKEEELFKEPLLWRWWDKLCKDFPTLKWSKRKLLELNRAREQGRLQHQGKQPKPSGQVGSAAEGQQARGGVTAAPLTMKKHRSESVAPDDQAPPAKKLKTASGAVPKVDQTSSVPAASKLTGVAPSAVLGVEDRGAGAGRADQETAAKGAVEPPPLRKTVRTLVKGGSKASSDSENKPISLLFKRKAPEPPEDGGADLDNASSSCSDWSAMAGVGAAPQTTAVASAADTQPAAEVMSPVERHAVAAEVMTQKVCGLIAEAQQKISMDVVRAAVQQIDGYDSCHRRKTVDKALLESMISTVSTAEQAYNSQDRDALLTTSLLKQLAMHEETLRVLLQPFIFGGRYTSYGRHFTKSNPLEMCVKKLLLFLHHEDTVVDFSCGPNEFVPMVKRLGAAEGLLLYGRAYDIITAKDLTDFKLQDWLKSQPRDFPHGDRLVIGLNPPFGKHNALANKFVSKAAEMNPRIIVLIVPKETRIPPGYQLVYEDNLLFRDKSFYIPGLGEDSWNKVAPPFRILVRMGTHDACMPGWESTTTVRIKPPYYGNLPPLPSTQMVAYGQPAHGVVAAQHQSSYMQAVPFQQPVTYPHPAHVAAYQQHQAVSYQQPQYPAPQYTAAQAYGYYRPPYQ